MGEGRERVAGFGPGKGEEGNVSVLTAPPETGRRLEEGRERNSPQPGTTCRRSTSREGPRSHRWGQTAPQTVKRQPQSMEGERGGRSLPPRAVVRRHRDLSVTLYSVGPGFQFPVSRLPAGGHLHLGAQAPHREMGTVTAPALRGGVRATYIQAQGLVPTLPTLASVTLSAALLRETDSHSYFR